MWKYDQGDYNELRNSLTNFNWDSIHDSNINTYAENIACVITDNASRVIPSKTVIVNSQEPPWMNCAIKKEIRRRKRLYKKANLSNNVNHWSNFKSVRNNVISLIRLSKLNYYERSSLKLKSGSLSPRDWWKTLKSMMSSQSSTSVPPLLDISRDLLVTDEHEKANTLNNYFANHV